jgi:hypothetical protein
LNGSINSCGQETPSMDSGCLEEFRSAGRPLRSCSPAAATRARRQPCCESDNRGTPSGASSLSGSTGDRELNHPLHGRHRARALRLSLRLQHLIKGEVDHHQVGLSGRTKIVRPQAFYPGGIVPKHMIPITNLFESSNPPLSSGQPKRDFDLNSGCQKR